MTASDYIRPAAASAQFSVSARTLSRWARFGWISTARVGGVRYYRAVEIAELIARNETRRAVVPISTASAPTLDEQWWKHRLLGRCRPDGGRPWEAIVSEATYSTPHLIEHAPYVQMQWIVSRLYCQAVCNCGTSIGPLRQVPDGGQALREARLHADGGRR